MIFDDIFRNLGVTDTTKVTIILQDPSSIPKMEEVAVASGKWFQSQIRAYEGYPVTQFTYDADADILVITCEGDLII